MPLRVSTSSFLSGGSSTIGRRRLELATLQQQISTGRKTEELGGDPNISRTVLRDEAVLREISSSLRNIDEAKELLTHADRPLQNVAALLQKVHELAVQGATDSYNAFDRGVIAGELTQIRDQLVQVANARIGDRFVFGGVASAQKPFDDSGPTVVFNGDTGAFRVPIGRGELVNATLPGGQPFIDAPTVTEDAIAGGMITGVAGTDAITINGVNIGAVAVLANDSDSALRNAINAVSGVTGVTASLDATGTKLVLSAATGATIDVQIDGATAGPAAGLTDDTVYGDVFAMIDALESALRANDGARIGEFVDDALEVLERRVDVQIEVGNTLLRLEGAESMLEGIELATQASLSDRRDTDIIEASERFKVAEAGLQAALVMTSRLEGLDLVSLIGR